MTHRKDMFRASETQYIFTVYKRYNEGKDSIIE